MFANASSNPGSPAPTPCTIFVANSGLMIFAFVLVHRPDLFTIGKQGGWALELQGMYLFTALALVFLGPGRYSVSRRF